VTTKVKICGLSTLQTARVAAQQGADFLGLVHFAKSPRHLSLNDMTTLIAQIRAQGLTTPLVSVVVDPDDDLLSELIDTVRPDLIQLHGHETPERVKAIAQNISVIKAISVSEAQDLDAADSYAPLVTHLMFDAKPPKDAALPGGMGLSFNPKIMQGYISAKPWFLAGGLNLDNVLAAIDISGAPMIDVSSGLERAPGLKDEQLIAEFMQLVKDALHA
jgi:phosphoribosylanthranilate isomerase